VLDCTQSEPDVLIASALARLEYFRHALLSGSLQPRASYDGPEMSLPTAYVGAGVKVKNRLALLQGGVFVCK
jgi:hypothetical protein